MNLNPDHPMLTAYAVGELDDDDAARAEVEAYLLASEDARRFVAAARATSGLLAAGLGEELAAAPALAETDRAAILDAAAGHPVRGAATTVYHVITHPSSGPRQLRGSLLAVAASVAIVGGTLALLLPALRRGREGSSRPLAQNNVTVVPDPITILGDHDTAFGLPDVIAGHGPDELLGTNVAGGGQASTAVVLENPFLNAARFPVSGFPAVVGRSSYEGLRRSLAAGRLPPRQAVRVEELVNAVPYQSPAPPTGAAIAGSAEVAACPWDATHRLVRIGLRARDGAGIAARDVAVGVEFNPLAVAAYRLIGFDRRIGGTPPPRGCDLLAGHAVTALYEVIPAGGAVPAADGGEPLRYQRPPEPTPAARDGEMLAVRVRFSDADGGPAGLLEFAASDRGTAYVDASPDFRLAAAAAGFGLVLRDSPNKGAATLDGALALARGTPGVELVALLERAREVAR